LTVEIRCQTVRRWLQTI